MGKSSLRPRAPATAVAMPGVISPISELGMTTPIGARMKSARLMETRIAFSPVAPRLARARIILSVVLAGDARLAEGLRRDELLPLGSRIRTRLHLDYAQRDDLLACLEHLLRAAGHAKLMTPELMHTLCDHAAGNYRVLTTMAAELLSTAAQRESTQLDEKLYLEVFAAPRTANTTQTRRATPARRR